MSAISNNESGKPTNLSNIYPIEFDSIGDLLSYLQKELRVPKDQENKFGGFNYRSAEDIYDAVKPKLPLGATLILKDAMHLIGDRYYLEAIANLSYKGEAISASAWAREELTKKGMDVAQITGAASSYARKYALGGLFLLGGEKDADGDEPNNKSGKSNNIDDGKLWYDKFEDQKDWFQKKLDSGVLADTLIEQLESKYKVNSRIKAAIRSLTKGANAA